MGIVACLGTSAVVSVAVSLLGRERFDYGRLRGAGRRPLPHYDSLVRPTVSPEAARA